MFKSARSRLRAAVFACAVALGLGAYAATPIAVWNGNFSESATINGATFNANGNTVAADGSYVKITGEKGAVFTLNKSYRYITAVFTVSNLNETAAYDRALAVVGGSTLFGAYLQSGTLTTHGINGNAIWPSTLTDSAYDATLTSDDAKTQRTFSLTQAHSSSSSSGTHLYEVYGGNTAAAIKFGGSGNNGLRAGQSYSKVVIGGMESYTEGTTLFKATSDLVILKVALYASDSTFPIAQADYETYSMPSMTVVTTPSTMSALNAAVAAASDDAVALSDVTATITLDEEPSDATKSILQSAYWQGTVLIKDTDKNNIVPSNYGNPNSTLKLSGVKGYFAAQQFNSSATPAIELEDSETEGREYGLWQNNGYSFYSGTSGTYQYMNTPELKGSGTYKIDTAETSSLFVADKFSNFTGMLQVTYGAVWLGVAVPSRDAAGRELVKVGTVRVSESFVNAPLSQWTGWTVANGYLGDVTVAAGSTNNYTDNRVNFLKADSWKGTVTISTATNNTNGHVEIWLSKLGGANSTIVINDLVSGGKDYYLNEGSYQNNPTFVSTIDINGDVQFKNGSSGQTVTFDKVTSDSATDKLTFAFPTSATLNFKINSLDNFAGTLSASSRTPLTIVDIVKTGATEGSLLVKVDENNANIASLSNTTLNGESADLELENGTDGYGIYVAVPATTVTITVPTVDNTTVTVTADGVAVSPTEEGGIRYEVADGAAIVVTYAAAAGYVIDGPATYEFTASEGSALKPTGTSAVQYAALVSDGTTHLRVSDALTYVYMLMPTNLTVTVTDATWEDNGTYDDYFVWDFNVRTYTPKEMAVRIGVHCYPTLASAVAEATDGQTATLLADVTLDATVVVTNSLTLNLNGFDIAATDARALWIKAGAVSITGEGEISANATENSSFQDSSSVIRVGDSAVNANAASLTIGADVTVSSGHCYGITTFGKNTPGISLVVNGTVAVTGTASAISGNGSSGLASANITVNDGAVVSATADAGIYFPGTGTLSIAGGTITGPTAVYVKCGTVNVTGGTLTGTAAKAPYAYNGDGLNATGDALVIDTCGYPGNPATVSVTGGTFTSQNADAVASYKKGDDAKYADDTANEAAAGFVSGGTFNTAVADTYCANGYEPKDNGDGTYGVREDKGWVYSAPGYWDYTGTWSDGVTLGEEKVTIEDGATYSNRTASAGQLVTVAMTLSFDDVNDDEEGYEDAKAAIRLGAGAAEGAYVFQLYTYEGSAATWKNATGFTPTVETDYNVLFVLDLTNKTYTASIVSGATTNVLSIGESITAIPFACQGEVTPVQTIDFVGSGTVSSIEDSYKDAPEPEGFVENQVIGDVTLTSAQAAWLNGQANYDALAARIAAMDATAFNDAYLLNLDILDTNSDYTFAVKGIVVGEDKVDVTVTLTRTGALTENEKAKPIVGTLKLKGTAALGTEFTVLGETAVKFDANADFGDGATETTVTVDTTETNAKFYRPVIE